MRNYSLPIRQGKGRLCKVSLNLGGFLLPRRHAGQRRHVTKRGHNLARRDI